MKAGFLKQTFEARGYPQAIDVGGELIAGPFCVHCGNPFSLHRDMRCPNRHMHPVFPPPLLPFEKPLRCVLMEGHRGAHRFDPPPTGTFQAWPGDGPVARCAVDENEAKRGVA